MRMPQCLEVAVESLAEDLVEVMSGMGKQAGITVNLVPSS